jgi:methionine biosynthesis protein MetW
MRKSDISESRRTETPWVRLPNATYDEIVKLIEPDSTVLDLGCGDGELLARLAAEKRVRGRGVDIEEEMILRCIGRGLSVFQGDLDEGLRDYGSGSYDYVILSRTLQVIKNPILVLSEMLRVGKRAVVSFPNFGHITNRLQLLVRGTMPVTKNLPYQWYDTPNIHLCTRKDFLELCRDHGIEIEREVLFSDGRTIRPFLPNLLATEVCFVLRGRDTGTTRS